MSVARLPLGPNIRWELLLVFIWLAAFLAFPVSTVRTAGTPQEPPAPAAINAQGLELYRSGKFEEAVAAFKQAIKLKADYSEAYDNLGNAYVQLGDNKKAVDAYKQAVRYQPDSATAHNNLGTAYFKLGEHKKAIAAFQEAIRLNPKEANYYYNLAAAYVERDDKKAALEQYQTLKAIDPPLAEKLYLLIHKPMATVYDSSAARLRVLVADSQGLPVNDLGKDDFQVFEDGLPQTISSFSKGQGPLVYGLTVDTSGSMRSVFELTLETCKSVIQQNLPDDEAVLIRFISSDKIETVQGFTSDQNTLNKALDTLYIEAGQSAILDAVYLAAQRVAQYKFRNGPRRRAVILVTDGDERTSYYSIDQLLKLLRQIDVQVFAISLADKKGAKLNLHQPPRWVELLTTLARETGGLAFFPKSVPELQSMTKQLMSLIRTGYDLEYKATGSVAGTYRRVTVGIAQKPGRENWHVLTRPGYLVSEKLPEK